MTRIPRYLMAVALVGASQVQPPKVAVVDVPNYIGQDVTVCGTVVGFACTQPETVELHLDQPAWTGNVAIVIPADKRGGFGPRVEDDYWTRSTVSTRKGCGRSGSGSSFPA